MKKTFIIANWKSNKTIYEADRWFQGLKIKDLRLTNKEIVICPSFTALPILKSLIVNHKSSIKLGAQDVSPFEEGAYTGEVSAKQIKEFADYVLIGHSERRKNFLESDKMINQKIDQAVHFGLTPILCISSIEQIQNCNSKFKIIIVYEPLFAIGSGQADTAENANSMAKKIREDLGLMTVLYGGSVTSKNVKEFTQMSNIDGVLVGGASLDAQQFYAIMQNA